MHQQNYMCNFFFWQCRKARTAGVVVSSKGKGEAGKRDGQICTDSSFGSWEFPPFGLCDFDRSFIPQELFKRVVNFGGESLVRMALILIDWTPGSSRQAGSIFGGLVDLVILPRNTEKLSANRTVFEYPNKVLYPYFEDALHP